MNSFIATLVIFLAFGCFNATSCRTRSSPTSSSTADDTLILVHTLFRHGNRTPNSKAYTNNPIANESFYSEGYGQLTDEGKRTEYRIGSTLRQRYNKFLGPTWNINYIEARSTNFNRTKMSLQLMLAGLWPPVGEQTFMPGLNWLPIPYNVVSNDKELSGTMNCKNYETLYEEMMNSDEIQEALTVYDEVFEYISNVTGDDFSSPDDIFGLYFEQTAQVDYGYPLEDWLQPIFPDTLAKITKDTYYIGTNSTDLKKIAGGFLLKKIINDSKEKISGTLTPQSRKMFVYSAHEKNVADFLITLDVFEDKIPVYGSHILVEVHMIDGVYGFKIFYHDWTTAYPKLLTIPGCEAFCPFDNFVSLFEEVIPDDSFCSTSS